MRTGITDSLLAQAQQDAGALLPDRCSIQDVTRVDDAVSGFTETWVDAYTNVPCRLSAQRVRQSESLQAGQLTPERLYDLTLLVDQPIKQTSRVILDGVTYEVVYIDAGKSYAITRRVQVVRKE